MQPEGSLPHLQEPVTCPYPESAQSSPCPHPTSWRSILILASLLRLGLQSGSFPQVSLPKSYTHLSFPPHVLHAPHLIRLDLITWTIFGDEQAYISLSSSLRSLLHSNKITYILNLNLDNEYAPVFCNKINVNAEFVVSKLDVTSFRLTYRRGAR
jgi:hypothetical protein